MKIKRYTLGRVTLAKTENSSLQGAGIVECENGEFVRHEEVESLLESIGAGGVSGRITSKTINEHRDEFEEWLLLGQTMFDPDATAKILQEVAWQAWLAARGITD